MGASHSALHPRPRRQRKRCRISLSTMCLHSTGVCSAGLSHDVNHSNEKMCVHLYVSLLSDRRYLLAFLSWACDVVSVAMPVRFLWCPGDQDRCWVDRLLRGHLYFMHSCFACDTPLQCQRSPMAQNQASSTRNDVWGCFTGRRIQVVSRGYQEYRSRFT